MYKLTNIIIPGIILFIFHSCTKTVANESIAQQATTQAAVTAGKVTPVGTPTGTPDLRVIGVNGGTFTTADKRVTIKIPQGALSKKDTITIQPISNYTPGGIGSAYRITPHGVNFAKPVTITFNYGNGHDDLSKTLPVALAIASQDANGIWQASGESNNDTTAKKISINTTHFSDWSLFRSYEIVPHLCFIGTGSSVLLKVVKRLNTGDLAMPLPAGPVYDTIEAEVKEWKLAGAGLLKPNKNTALYTAPLIVPAKQPVKVSAELATTAGACVLLANIYIGVGANGGTGQGTGFTGEGVVFRVDKGPWKYAICANGVKMIHTPLGDERFFTAFIPGSPNADALTFHWMDHARVGSTLKWTTTFPDFQYSYKENNNSVYYFQYSLPDGIASAGGIKWLESDELPGLYTAGTFTITTSGKITVPKTGVPPPPENHQIDGFFNIAWGGN